MIVNMSATATQEQIEHVMERIKECGFLPHLIQGAERTVIGVVGKNRGRRSRSGSASRRAGRGRHHFDFAAIHAGEPRTAAAANGGGRERREDRRAQPRRDRGAVLGRIARAIDGDRARREGGRRESASRRRVQTAHFAVRFSGPRPRRAEDSCGSERRRPACPSSPK